MSNLTRDDVNTLESLTKDITAFSSWFEFANAMHNGYCPTLTPWKGRTKVVTAHNAKVAELADRLEDRGFKVFRG